MMKRAIYMAFTLITALSMGGCSSALTTKDLTILEEAEVQSSKASNKSEDTAQSSSSDQKADDKEITSDIASVQQETGEPTSAVGRISKAAQESEMKLSLEGMTETIPTRLYTSDLGYQMQVDEQRFTYERKDGADLYQTANPDSTKYPDIYIKISNHNLSDKDYLTALEDRILEVNPKAEKPVPVQIGTYDAIHFHSIFGEDYNSKIDNLYVIEGDESYYTIEVQYFLEAEEGYGARIAALLDTFTLTR